MADSRNKGASFEREVAKLLVLEMGISFKRDLRQYQTSGHGDLIPSDPAFPFELELKRYAKGPISGTDKWWQASHDRSSPHAQAACADLQVRPAAHPLRGRDAGHPLQHLIRRFLLPSKGDHGA
jgi:hypothetical protein